MSVGARVISSTISPKSFVSPTGQVRIDWPRALGKKVLPDATTFLREKSWRSHRHVIFQLISLGKECDKYYGHDNTVLYPITRSQVAFNMTQNENFERLHSTITSWKPSCTRMLWYHELLNRHCRTGEMMQYTVVHKLQMHGVPGNANAPTRRCGINPGGKTVSVWAISFQGLIILCDYSTCSLPFALKTL